MGVLIAKSGLFEPSTKVEVLTATTSGPENGEITAEIRRSLKTRRLQIAGESRVDDLLIIAGGFQQELIGSGWINT